MKYSRRHFLKAAGSGAVVLTTVGGYASVAGSVAAAQTAGEIPAPMTVEIGTGPDVQAAARRIDNGRTALSKRGQSLAKTLGFTPVSTAPWPGDSKHYFLDNLRPPKHKNYVTPMAMGLEMAGDTITDSRVVFGGISGRPYRERAVEDFLRGKTLDTALAAEAPGTALAGAAPLKYNAMKIDMAKGLLRSGLEKLSTA